MMTTGVLREVARVTWVDVCELRARCGCRGRETQRVSRSVCERERESGQACVSSCVKPRNDCFSLDRRAGLAETTDAPDPVFTT